MFLSRLLAGVGLTALLLLVAGCNYDAPLTAAPTRQLDRRLLGEWLQPEEHEWLVIRELDDATYVIAYGKEGPNGRANLYRAVHTDFAGRNFVSVENLQPGIHQGKYAYLTWELSADREKLTLRLLSTKVIPEQPATTATMQKLVTQQLENPALFNEPLVFQRPARVQF